MEKALKIATLVLVGLYVGTIVWLEHEAIAIAWRA
jgi:hypothetical protein